MNLALAQHDLLAVLLQHVMPIFAALRMKRFCEALREVSRELLASDRLTLLTFQFNSPRARLLFTTHPDLASFIGRLLPFDECVLCDSLRAAPTRPREREGKRNSSPGRCRRGRGASRPTRCAR